MSGKVFNAAYVQKDIPQEILQITRNEPISVTDRASRYGKDIEVLKNYILDLRTDIDSLLGRLESLSTAEKYLGTLKKIQDIINEEVDFPIPC